MGRHLIIQKASAGSGKTYQLALNYIRMALGEPNSSGSGYHLFYPNSRNRHREILAVTFTNKATEEMKQRIIGELRALSNVNSESNYRTGLMADFGVDSQTLATASAAALNDILFDYGNFHVSTIDAFFQTVLRSFAYEADLSGNYDLELNDKTINEQAINDTIGAAVGTVKATNARQLKGWMQTYISSLRIDSKGFDLLNPSSQSRSVLLDFIEDLTDESFKSKKEDILKFAEDPRKITDLHDAVKNKLNSLSSEIVEAADLNIGDLPGNNKLKNFCNKVRTEGWPISSDYSDLFCDVDNVLSKVKEGCEATKAAATHLTELVQLYYTAQIIFSHIHNYGLFSAVLQFAERLKIDNNTILLSDTNTLLHQIIGDSETPFIYERIGRRFRHYLIDEFQDTSGLQWANLKPLLLESLSEDNDNLIIGDVKQCIYRFRNSDPKLLDTGLSTDPSTSRHLNEQPHNTNFRSSKVIVDFNNDLFRRLSIALGCESVYSTVEQQSKRTDVSGYVSINISDEGENSGLDRMVDEMVRQLDPEQGNYKPGDIAVLVRWNSEGRKVINYLLSETAPGGRLEGINILSDEALLISSSPAVQYIINSLKRRIDLFETKEYSMYSTPETAMEQFDERLRRLTDEGLSPEQALEQAIQELKNNSSSPRPLDQSDSTGLSLFETVEEMIGKLPDEWRSKEAIYLCAFQDMILDYCRTLNPNIYDFLEFWNNTGIKSAISFSGSVNAIRVLTIHKSKGLEFPCVHLPILPKSLIREEDFRWYNAKDAFAALNLPCPTPDFYPIQSSKRLLASRFSSQYETRIREARLDELNALYVAFTRAKQELIISLHPIAKDPGPDNVSALIWAALDSRTKFGAPTINEKNEKEDAISGPVLTSYEISRRTSPWTFTQVSTEELE